ncbi:hypothetical protein [Thiomicrorhabdus sp.]|uniref:hypothetical protein n=1 Tax=Thiomicrorhabdus sp. TaxID=2039724 RepID=UPI0029C9AE16|nr:hypothetical protein [Thiomicrorhabdus sp.]
MKYSELIKLNDRAKRVRERLDIKDGDGFSWTITKENDEQHEIVLNNVKTPEELEDDIASIFVWLWNLKDYVKKYSKIHGYPSNWVEEQINLDFNLCICGDIANGIKHGGLDRKTRSNKKPKLGNIHYQVEGNAIDKIVVQAFKVLFDVSQPDQVSLSMDVYDENGEKIGDAFKLLDYAISAWNEIIQQIQRHA